MFFFGGLLGILLELTSAKRMLSTAALRLDGRPLPDVPRPPSWAGSFNPFPALVIGVTGLAMSAHHQAYVFAIEVHALWGNLLALSAIFRIAYVPCPACRSQHWMRTSWTFFDAGRTSSCGSGRHARSYLRARQQRLSLLLAFAVSRRRPAPRARSALQERD